MQAGLAGREAPVVLALGAPLRFTAAAESSQLCKSVNLGVQAVEVAELGLVLGVVTLLFLRFLSCWAEDSAKVPAFRDFLSRPTFVQSF